MLKARTRKRVVYMSNIESMSIKVMKTTSLSIAS